MKSPAKSCLPDEQGLTLLSACSGGTSVPTPCTGHHQWKWGSSLCPSFSPHTSQLFLEELPCSWGASFMAQMGKNLQQSRWGFNPWVRKIPWRRDWQPTPVFWSEEFQGQRSLAGYSPWGHKEVDTTEQLTVSLSLQPPSWIQLSRPGPILRPLAGLIAHSPLSLPFS